jgi:predicted RNase H-like HicB family nuclease
MRPRDRVSVRIAPIGPRDRGVGTAERATRHHVKIAEAVEGMTRTYTFVFAPEPEGGYTVTCPALPGLVTYGETLDEARTMAHDAMEGLIEVMVEHSEAVPESYEGVPRP